MRRYDSYHTESYYTGIYGSHCRWICEFIMRRYGYTVVIIWDSVVVIKGYGSYREYVNYGVVFATM